MSTMPGSLCLLQNLPFCSPGWLNLALVLQSSAAQTLTMTQLRVSPVEIIAIHSSRVCLGCLLPLTAFLSATSRCRTQMASLHL